MKQHVKAGIAATGFSFELYTAFWLLWMIVFYQDHSSKVFLFFGILELIIYCIVRLKTKRFITFWVAFFISNFVFYKISVQLVCSSLSVWAAWGCEILGNCLLVASGILLGLDILIELIRYAVKKLKSICKQKQQKNFIVNENLVDGKNDRLQ